MLGSVISISDAFTPVIYKYEFGTLKGNARSLNYHLMLKDLPKFSLNSRFRHSFTGKVTVKTKPNPNHGIW